MPILTDIIYSDFTTAFTAHPVSGDLARITNDEAIIRSVKNIVFTQFYERPFRPSLGSDVLRYLFENFSVFTSENLTEAITEAIENNEPRVTLMNVHVSETVDDNRLRVSIVFRIRNNTNPTNVQVYLERVR